MSTGGRGRSTVRRLRHPLRRVYGVTARRKRQVEYLTLLEHLDRAIPATITTIHLLADNVSVHHGKLVRRWLDDHPRFVAHFTPVHCSWMNPVEQWFSILRRKRLRPPNFADLAALPAGHPPVHRRVERDRASLPLDPASFDKILAKVEAALAADTPALDALPNPSDTSEDLY